MTYCTNVDAGQIEEKVKGMESFSAATEPGRFSAVSNVGPAQPVDQVFGQVAGVFAYALQ